SSTPVVATTSMVNAGTLAVTVRDIAEATSYITPPRMPAAIVVFTGGTSAAFGAEQPVMAITHITGHPAIERKTLKDAAVTITPAHSRASATHSNTRRAQYRGAPHLESFATICNSGRARARISSRRPDN